MDNFYDHLHRWGGTKPAAIALRQGQRWFSFAELDARSQRVAGAIEAGALGSRIAVIAENTIEFFEVVFGAAAAGAVVVPLNTRLLPAELVALVIDSEADTVVLSPARTDLVPLIQAAAARVRRIVVLGEEYESLLASQPRRTVPVPDAGERVLALVYTSGTTGVPKGVQLTQRNLDAFSQAGRFIEVSDDSLCLMTMPLFHIGALGLCLTSLVQGMGGLLLEPRPEAIVEAIATERVSHMFVVPTTLRAMAEVAEDRGGDYSSLRQIIYGASPIDTHTLRRVMKAFDARVKQGYGSTETGSITHLLAEHHDLDRPQLLRSAGVPRDGVEIRIVDPDTGQDVPPGTTGEVWVRSQQVSPGYWKKPELTAEVLTSEGWFRTGDGGYFDAEGFLFLTARLKDIIISGAENVYPQEVEEVLLQHPQIAEVAVVGTPDAHWGESVCAVVVPAPGADLAADQVIDWARDRLPGFKRPRRVELVAGLPRNPSGKVLRAELRTQLSPTGDDILVESKGIR